MKFAKISATLAAILSLYVLFFNYNMLDYIYITKQRKEIPFITGYREIVIPESRSLGGKKARPDVLDTITRTSTIYKGLGQQPKERITSTTQTHSSAPRASNLNTITRASTIYKELDQQRTQRIISTTQTHSSAPRASVLDNIPRASTIYKDSDQQSTERITSTTQTHSSAPRASNLNTIPRASTMHKELDQKPTERITSTTQTHSSSPRASNLNTIPRASTIHKELDQKPTERVTSTTQTHSSAPRASNLDSIANTSRINKDLDHQSKRQTTGEIRTHSPTPSAIEMNSPNVSPFYETYEAMMKDDASNTRTYPTETACPYLGLRKPYVTSIKRSQERVNTTCRKRLQSSQDCKDAVKYYGPPGSQKARECPLTKAVILCTILKNRTSEKHDFKVSCDDSKCDGKPIMVALFDEKTGMIGEKWTVVPGPKFLGQLFRRHVSSSRFRSRFVWLKCEGNDAFQVLMLPKISKRSKKRAKPRNQKRLNINIVIEDSLSRPHFYRTLSKTVSTFRNIIHDESIPATVLDFEMFQSYASMTSGNLKRLFTGRKYVDSTTNLTDSYGTEEFFPAFKSEGYTTLFQEDNCWFDTWGTLLDGRQGGLKIRSKKKRTQRWKSHMDILKTTKLNDVIDDFGLTFLTCSVYDHFNVTNIFSGRKFPKVCFNGRHYSSLFLEYVKNYAISNDESQHPFISYTHLLTSHERTGKRIVNDDASLADLFLSAAYLRNTVTIFASDHGGKSSAFSTYSTQGRQEAFQPLLFIIMPHQVQTKLGVQVLNSLVVNQKRLAGLEDIHYALLSLRHLWRVGTNTKPDGLFRPLPLNRTCEDLVLDSDVLCLCEGMDKTVANDSRMVLWAAEYVLGTLNNRIQRQYVASLKRKGHLTSDYNGYGACQRYTGVEIRRARHVTAGENQTLQFSLHVQPFHIKTIEVFDAQVTFPIHEDNGIVLNKLVRVSMFNVYEQCADDGVDPRLCACHEDDTNITLRQNEFISNGYRKESFSLEPKTSILDYPCLAIVSRSRQRFIRSRGWQDTVITYEAINACALVTYKLKVDIRKAVKTRLSLTRPTNVTLFPRTMTFLMTANNEWKYGRVIPKFTFEKITLK